MSVNNNVAMENELPRPDVDEKVSGRAKFAADTFPQNVIYAKYVRFPYGAGKVTRSDVEAAKAVKGVLHVEVNAEKTAQYPGDQVGKIAAESLQALKDAEAALKLRFEQDKPRTEPMKFYEGVPEPKAEEKEALDKLFAEADAVIESTYTTQVQTHSCLEPHGCVIDYKSDGAKAWASTQGVMGWEDGLAGSSGHPASKVTVDATYVGGGFGSKFGMGAEGNLALEMSKKFSRPCRVVLDRREEHLDAGNRPGSIQYFKMAAKKDGTILGGRQHMASIVGFRPGGGGVAENWLQYYKSGKVVRTASDVTLNFAIPRAFRAPGHPQAAFAFEGMMDELAAKIGMDPLEFRQKNDTSDRRKKQYKIGAELIGWKDRKADGAGKGIIKTGYGVASASWFNSPGKCDADVDIHSSGEVEVRVGVQDIGTGTSAVVADVVADHLGLERATVTGKCGISDYPPGPASGGSFVTRTTAPALKDAAQNALDKLKKAVAAEWAVAESDVEYDKGTFRAGNEKLEWKEACQLINGKIAGKGSYTDKFFGEGNSDCVQFAKVEVDTETGNVRVKKIVAVHAMGKPVNRLTAENQVYGGVIQGVSYALFEDRLLDPHTGGMVNADFIGYKIAGAADIPEIIPVLDVEENDTGARSLGEPVTVPTSGAIANAVANAIGVRVYDLPMTPDRVLAALARKDKGATA
jgi:xanthine dehydrogenase YagR molybdenum-binding subunit